MKNTQAANKGLSLGKVADFCGVTRKTILRWVNEGMIESFVLPSGHHRVLPGNVAAFLRQHNMPVPGSLIADDRKTILIADDEEDVRLLVSSVLKDKYALSEVNNGIEACIKLGKDPPDLVIMDVRMPKMDGVEVCRQLRIDKTLATVKIMVLSGYLDRETFDRLDGLVDACLAKPFNTTEFAVTVDKLLG